MMNINSSDFTIDFFSALNSHPKPGISLSTGTPDTSTPSLSLSIPPITTVSPLLIIRFVLMFLVNFLCSDGAVSSVTAICNVTKSLKLTAVGVTVRDKVASRVVDATFSVAGRMICSPLLMDAEVE